MRLPPHAPGLRIGLYGGSFNPPHEGHRLLAQMAIRRLGLHRVWWLVTPGNPLKAHGDLPPLDARIALVCALLGRDRRMVVTGLEAAIGTRYSAETLRALRRRLPFVHFVWLMGADNLANFHHWRHWRRIAALAPMAIMDRPDARLKAIASPAARRLAQSRLDEAKARHLPGRAPPAWIFLHGRRSALSSSDLRGKSGEKRIGP